MTMLPDPARLQWPVLSLLGIAALGLFGFALQGLDWSAAERVAAASRGLSPSFAHPFGTDMLGRDGLTRTLLALWTSVRIGLTASAISTVIALVMALAAASHPAIDRLVQILTELVLGLPHLVLVIFVSYAAGGGASGVVLGVALTHWPRLSRVLRHEAQLVATSDYVLISRMLGRGPLWLARHHLIPHLIPFLIAGFVLIFPHAVLHEAALSFLGLGVEPHVPSIGIMLSESLRAIMAGQWWTALFPGLGLLTVALSFEICGERLARRSQLATSVEEISR